MEKVAVLLSAYNGEQYIRGQIDSILAQEQIETELYVRDDGSTDGTRRILEEYRKKGMLTWYTGENKKAALSFMDLIRTVQTEAKYIALSDQDDIWLKDKLKTAVDRLKEMPEDRPALYYGNTKLVDQELKEIGQEPITYVSSTMKQSVISSGCTGCTLCMNRALFELVRQRPMKFEMIHDMWIHKLCIAAGGSTYFDREAHILYRQHGSNVIGGQSSFSKRMKRHARTAFKNRCYRSLCCNALYETYGDCMPDENKAVCELVKNYHRGLNRFRIVFDRGYRLGDRRLDLIFIVSVLLGVF